MACVAAAHATWIPKEAEAATASFPLQPPSPSSSAVDDPANESQRPCPLVAGLAPTGMEVLVVEVGEPGLPRAPRGGGAEVGRRHVGQARLSVLDRWPRWVAVTPAKEWRQPAQKAEDFAPPPSYPHSVVFYASFKGAEPPQRPRPSRIKRPG